VPQRCHRAPKLFAVLLGELCVLDRSRQLRERREDVQLGWALRERQHRGLGEHGAGALGSGAADPDRVLVLAGVPEPAGPHACKAADSHNARSPLSSSGGAPLAIGQDDVTFCDSSGVSALVCGHARASAAAGGLRITAVSSQVHRVLHMTGLTRMFGLAEVDATPA
jgi:anti-anti-sigma factor